LKDKRKLIIVEKQGGKSDTFEGGFEGWYTIVAAAHAGLKMVFA
jgi:hypothetical protein